MRGFGFNCIGYGIENAGWNHHWMYPGPCFGMGSWYGGYNPRISDITMIGRSICSVFDGISAGITAHNYGADNLTATNIAFGTTAYGTESAIWGNMVDKSTGSYIGSIMGSAYTNPFYSSWGYNAGSYVSPYMFPFGGPFGMSCGFYC